MIQKLNLKSILLLAFFLSAIIPNILAGKDYYSILGIPKDANEKTIKSAYRQLSKKYHPDKNPNDEEAHNMFIEIGEAYEILSDAEKRRTYDQFGSDAFANGGHGPGGPGGHGGGGGFHDPFDLFNQMFNNGRFGGGNENPFNNNRKQKLQGVQVKYPLSLKDYFHGGSVQFDMQFKDTCTHCSGTGSEDGKVHKCPECGGQGIIIQVIRMGPVTQQVHAQCPKCRGSGSVVKNICKKCHGHKVVDTLRNIKTEIEAGIPQDFIKVIENGADNAPGMEAGDLYIHFEEIADHNLGFRRRGNDLYRTEPLTFKESIEGGWSRTLPFLDENRDISISRPAGVPVLNKEVEKIQGFGMPIQGTSKFGDLYIDYVVIVPKSKTLRLQNIHDEF